VNSNSNGNVGDYDQVNIVCPLYDRVHTPVEAETEKFVIYHVKKEEYDTCQIMSAHPRIIARCDKPYMFLYFTISFRPFSPTPGALEFHPGKDYYFISTSSKTDLHRRMDGMCRTNNMRLVFKVADPKKKEPETTTQQLPALSSPPEAMYTYGDQNSMSGTVEFSSVVDNGSNQVDDVDNPEDEDKLKKGKKKKNKKKRQRKDKKGTNPEDNERDVQSRSAPHEIVDEEALQNDKPPNQLQDRGEQSLLDNVMKHEAAVSSPNAAIVASSSPVVLLITLFYAVLG
jgi:hypothetical protein